MKSKLCNSFNKCMRKCNGTTSIVVAAVALAVLWSAFAYHNTSLNGQTLVIATNTDYPPFGYRTPGGSLVGFDYAYGTKLCEMLKADCQWQSVPFEEIIGKTASGEFDLAVASVTRTAYREDLVDFSKPYYYSFGQFVRKAGSSATLGENSVVAVQRGTIYEQYLNSLVFEDMNLLVFPFSGQEEAFRAVAQGAAELTIADDVLVDLAVLESPFLGNGLLGSFERVGERIVPKRQSPEYESLGSGGIGIIVTKDNKEVLKKVNRAIRRIRSDRDLAALSEEYFGRNILKKTKTFGRR